MTQHLLNLLKKEQLDEFLLMNSMVVHKIANFHFINRHYSLHLILDDLVNNVHH